MVAYSDNADTSPLPSILMAKQQNNIQLVKTLEKVLRRIIPRKDEIERIKKYSDRIKKDLETIISSLDVDAEVRLEGSVAKGTWLSGDVDLDFFILIRYDPEKTKKFFLELLRKIMATLPYDFQLRYAEHPYLRAKINGLEVDIVPAYKSPPQHIISSVDRTPHHTSYILSRITPTLANEIRLLKAFLKGIGTYGAEVRVGGLSGYACELLILHYGSFLKTIVEFSRRKTFFIDPTGSWKKKDATKKFQHHPFILIDPTDRTRNVTSALRPQTLSKIQIYSKLFLQNPSTKFFFPEKKEIDVRNLNRILDERHITLILLEKTEDIAPDIYWGQALRIKRKIRSHIEKSGFQVVSIDEYETERHIILIIETTTKKLPHIKKIYGPPTIANIRHILRFYQKHKDEIISGPWIENSRIWILIKNKQQDLYTHLQQTLQKIRMDPSFRTYQILQTPQEIIKYAEENSCIEILTEALSKDRLKKHLEEIIQKLTQDKTEKTQMPTYTQHTSH